MRRRWVQKVVDGKSVFVEVPLDYVGRRRSMSDTDRLVTESHYDGVKATDGTPIDTRERHKRYMRENNLAHAHDFSPQYYENVRKERAREEKRYRKQAVINAVTHHEKH